MVQARIAGAALALGLLGSQEVRVAQPALLLKEETMFIEYTPTLGEAALVVEAESEAALERVDVRSPHGTSLLSMRAQGGRSDRTLSGFSVETRESNLAALFEAYPEGVYGIHAGTSYGQPVVGTAVLSHALLDEPVVLYPREGSENVSEQLEVSWIPDHQAVAYRIVLEQGENDGLTAQLPADSHSFRVPDGILAPRTESHLEIAAVGPNGNRTLVEVFFTTR